MNFTNTRYTPEAKAYELATRRSEMTHTPGPWYSRKWDDGEITVDHDASAIATIHHVDEEAEANARLIAAAPALLKALERIAKVSVATTDPTTRLQDISGITRGAIALAKGETVTT